MNDEYQVGFHVTLEARDERTIRVGFVPCSNWPEDEPLPAGAFVLALEYAE